MGKIRLFFLLLAAFVFCTKVDAQTKKITGTVISSDDDSRLQGVSVSVKGTNRGSLTDTKGKFSLNASTGETLVISYVGFQGKDLTVGEENDITIKLAPTTDNMKSVVVIGYGTARKRQLVGASTTVSATEAGATIATNPSQLLIGKAAGVQVVNSSGTPGSSSQIVIRGTGSFTNVDPLYVIDGVQANGAIFNSLSTQDIESITILKDASSTAIYGAAAANGVVLITTKKAKSGTPRISVTSQVGTSKAWKLLDLLKAKDYVDLMKDYAATKGVPVPAKLNSPEALIDQNDWQKLMFRNAPSTENDINVSGGSEKVLYNFSLGYITQKAIIKDYQFKRLNSRFSLDETLGRFHLGQSLNISYTKSSGMIPGLFWQGVTTYAPYQPIYDSTVLGGYSIMSNLNDLAPSYNPMQSISVYHQKSDGYVLVPQLFAEVNLLKGLSFRSQFNATYSGGTSSSFQQAYTGSNFIDHPRLATLDLFNSFTFTLENYLSYNRWFGKHNISAMAGTSYIDEGYYNEVGESGSTIANDNLQNVNVALSRNVSASTQTYGTLVGRTKSYFGRLIYSYNDRYVLTASLRRDGSSNFGPNNRYGNFPAAGFAWNFTQEDFIKRSLPFISDGKVRVGWGRTGNNRFGLGKTDVYTYSGVPSGSLIYSFGPDEVFVPGTSVATISNPYLRWEQTEQTNIGLDLGFLQNRLTLNVDFYNRKSTGLLVNVLLPGSTGIMGIARLGDPSVLTNAADAQNRGIELALGYRSKPVRDFTYNVSANFSYNKNNTLSLGSVNQFPIKDGGLNGSGTITYTAQGSPIGAFYGYRVDHVAKDQGEIDALNAKSTNGTYQNGLLPGDFIFKDLNHDGVVDSKDQELLGSPMPKIMYGFNAGATFRNFDLNIVISGLSGVQIANATKYYTQSVLEAHNTTTALLNRWRQPGDIAALPRAGQSSSNLRPSDWYIEDGSYLRVRNVTLGYTISRQALKSFSHDVIQGIRLFVAAQNLLTITGYSGYDPEIGTDAGSSFIFRRGIDNGSLPQPRTFMGGVQIQF